MKKVLLPVLFLSTALCFSCKDDEDPATACGVADPVEELAWLKAIKENAESSPRPEYTYITQATFEGETVFYSGNCDPLANWALVLYDCGGNQIEEEYTFEDLEDAVTIWQPEESVCAFSSENG
ncbi:hypothetical protein PBT90_04445 [Algoriphagus halophytocola]|uniref:Uncharacterized protein n=1 Tax=Algoriphagus halophytocola TaxID=2991499 RepID=A0ABY6MGA9_9BACT|nr:MULTISPECIES: hypothetical protein [unclassified Algoriphagus]UZD22668.1 hypothetical protein OM944_18705 [Algoriphagus sp. TR-M5]WBL43933.1 hypothetical protein PBT90_04445 [Algoriphagus sp. TR-M9]